jgi:hypothetical protein
MAGNLGIAEQDGVGDIDTSCSRALQNDCVLSDASREPYDRRSPRYVSSVSKSNCVERGDHAGIRLRFPIR